MEKIKSQKIERRVDNAALALQIAVMESAIERAQADMEELATLLKEHMIKEEEERRELMKRLDDLVLSQARYKGVIGGVVLTVSAIFTVGGMLMNYFMKHP